MNNISFKKGIYQLNKDPNINYQLNRMIMWNGGDLDEVKSVAPKIHDCKSWEKEILSLGDKALTEGRTENAIGYIRMAEFFMYNGNPKKMMVYDKARELFYSYYSQYFGSEAHQIQIEKIPYENRYLPCWHIGASGEKKDTILLHGGNDSLIEEFLFTVLYIAKQGFEVYCFEGPGQGEVLKKCGIPFTNEWERPVKAILDYYSLEDVTIVGVSLGGVLAPRAAAFEKRIKRVVGWSIIPNLLEVGFATRPKAIRRMTRLLLKTNQRWFINFVFNKMAAKEELIHWAMNHGKYAYDCKDAFEYIQKSDNFDMVKIAHMITQDFLLLGAKNDHFIDFSLYKKEIDALKNVRSLTFRVFTDKEQADNHCNMGNSKLAIDTILNWICQTKKVGVC
jgi:pimeloyl-ACP methyl ester carboxylesterase